MNDKLNIYYFLKLGKEQFKKIAVTAMVFTVLGIILAYTSKPEYRAYTVLIPDNSSSMSDLSNITGAFGGLMDLSSLGIGIGGKELLGPDLYEDVIESGIFYDSLLKEEFHFFEIDSSITLYEYFRFNYFSLPHFLLKYTIKLPWTLKRALFKSHIQIPSKEIKFEALAFSDDEVEVIETLKERITLNYDRRNNTVRISTLMPDQLVAVKCTEYTRKYLENFVYKTQLNRLLITKAYLEQSIKSAEKNLDNSQHELSIFEDQNKNITSSSILIERERLKSNYDLSFSIYSNLKKQIESIKLQITEEKPLFITLKPIMYPIEKESPKRVVMVFLFALFGILIGFFVVLLPTILNYYREQISSQKFD